jgi:adsorption protein B
VPGSYHFLSIFEGRFVATLLAVNFLLMANRMVQRVIFVSGYYGWREGLAAIPRLFWGNLINFLANWRAIRQVVLYGNPRRVAWDKTMHEFPAIGEPSRARQPIGQILVAQGRSERRC